MKRNSVLFATLLLMMIVALVVAGCSSGDTDTPGEDVNNNPADSAYPLTVTDALGREVTLETKPERVVSLMPSLTEILFALEASDRVVGVTTYCNYPAEALAKDKVGDLFNLNTETILALEPDLVLTGRSDTIAETLSFLEENGIPYIVVDPTSLDEIEASITQVATIIAEEEKGNGLVTQIQADRATMAEKVAAVADADRPNIFVLLDTEYLYTVGEGEFLSEVITAAGGNNIAAGLGKGYPMLSEETFFELDPDIIICTFPMSEQVLAKESWQDLQAVKNGRVYDVDGDLVSRPGPRIVSGLEELYSVFFE